MTLALYAFVTVSMLELGLYVPAIWRWRRFCVPVLIFLIAVVHGLVLSVLPPSVAAAILLIGIYRFVNLSRIPVQRLEPHFLKQSTQRTAAWLILSQFAVLWAWQVTDYLPIISQESVLIVAVLQLLAAAGLLFTTWEQLRKSKIPAATALLADRDLPTVSVCIPARDETADLNDCLNMLVASNYPKLEILVLDDLSHDNTPDIIKGFAHAGVRFVKGTEPPNGWLAKNWAYQQLFEQANGELILFCGVDVRQQPPTLRLLVQHLLTERKQMLCVTPVNKLSLTPKWKSKLIQPVRYAWEISLPRYRFRRPPVLSTYWLVQRKLLEKAGSFAAVHQMVTPESYFARQAAKTHDYRFICADATLELTSEKSWQEQWQTSVRTRYPQLHRRAELVLLVSLLQLMGIAMPPVLLLMAALTGAWLIALLSAATVFLHGLLYGILLRVTYSQKWRWSASFWPAALLDIYIRNYSLFAYEFGHVNWRGRDITFLSLHSKAER